MTRQHVPVRPKWRCHACAEDWPCPIAKSELTRDLSAQALVLHLSGLIVEAGRDLPTANPEHLARRFLAWTGGV